MLLKEVFNRGPNLYPDKIAVIDGKRMFTYQEAGERHNRLANALMGFGLQRGDHLGLLLENCLSRPLVKLINGASGSVICSKFSKQELRLLFCHCLFGLQQA